MPKAIVTMLLAVMSSGAAAEWVEVYETDPVTFYVDPTTIRKSGNKVKMWDLLDHKEPEKTYDDKPYISQRSQVEYDCKVEKWRTLFSTLFSKSMAGGDAIYTLYDPGKWTPTPPNTAAEVMWKLACGKP